MRTLGRPTAITAITAAVVVLGAGGACAYWTTTGIGAGTVSVATVKPLVIEQPGVTDLALGRPAPLTAKMMNPNDFEASLLATQISVKVTADADHRGCDIRNFEVTAPSTTAKLIAAKESLELDKGSITLLNSTLDQTACHGATLTLSYLLGRASSIPATTPGPAAPTTAAPLAPTRAPTGTPTAESTAASGVKTSAGSAAAPPADPFATRTAAPSSGPTP